MAHSGQRASWLSPYPVQLSGAESGEQKAPSL